ncbi:ras-induced vulval development antagonist-domain-containing protein [Gautieria morchelliformis]|nr:ras-induced vulval development antagonist-domain-containing protein [Gautieria morchelliformis]
MATVHPSRMGLVPQDSREYPRSRHRSSSLDRNQDRNVARHRSPSQDRDWRRDRGRRSPKYDEYKKSSEPAPWRAQDNMYPNRGGGENRYSQDGWGGNDYLTSRQQQRESRNFSIWPPSPKSPVREISPGRHSKPHRRSRKRDRSPSTSYSDSSSSEEERRRREKKARKKAKEQDRAERGGHKRSRPERRRSSEDEDESRGRNEDRRREARSVGRTHSPEEDEEDEWVEKGTSSKAFVPVPASSVTEVAHFAMAAGNHDSDTEVGPQPLTKASTSKVDERSYGGALLRGEGSAMAAFLAEDTNARIPRRGEIGLTSDEIASYESVGYVMSGSRHRRMNAVRMRKENQVISAEEKRGILKLQKEERERREEVLREEFKELVDERLKAGGKK